MEMANGSQTSAHCSPVSHVDVDLDLDLDLNAFGEIVQLEVKV